MQESAHTQEVPTTHPDSPRGTHMCAMAECDLYGQLSLQLAPPPITTPLHSTRSNFPAPFSFLPAYTDIRPLERDVNDIDSTLISSLDGPGVK